MEYRYQVLEDVIVNIGRDSSTENIYDEVGRLTSDERRKLAALLFEVEGACYSIAKDMGEVA